MSVIKHKYNVLCMLAEEWSPSPPKDPLKKKKWSLIFPRTITFPLQDGGLCKAACQAHTSELLLRACPWGLWLTQGGKLLTSLLERREGAVHFFLPCAAGSSEAAFPTSLQHPAHSSLLWLWVWVGCCCFWKNTGGIEATCAVPATKIILQAFGACLSLL